MVNEFVDWWYNAFLQLNVHKTKDMCINFKQKPHNTNQETVIKGQTVDIVEN